MFCLGEDPIMSDQQQYKYMTVDDIKGLDDNIRLDTSHDDKADKGTFVEASIRSYQI